MKIEWTYKLHITNTKGWLAYEYLPLHNLVRNNNIVDFITDTDKLEFDLEHPVDIIPQTSYDGTVNLILNDGAHKPRLINTRFTVRENNKYEIIDREGNADTNLYKEKDLDLDTSLFKRVETIPKLEFEKVTNTGCLAVGNYTIYIKLADEDGNETDFVAESGIISCFLGNDKDPFSINGGYRDMNSFKTIHIKVSNIDPIYDYAMVYYVRATSDTDGNALYKATKITERYRIQSGECKINITGYEEHKDIDLTEIDREFFIASSAKAQVTCLNMLFLGNVTKPNPYSADLDDLSLRIKTELIRETASAVIGSLNDEYAEDSLINGFMYYNTQNIYNKVGYRNHEMYRFGIVYIYEDNSLSSVYNMAGGLLSYNGSINVTDALFNAGDLTLDNRKTLLKNLDNYTLSNYSSYNYKGVMYIEDTSAISSFPIYHFQFTISDAVKNYLKNELHIKGYFFVRQKRIPRILTQVYTMAIDPVAYIPLINCDYRNTDYLYQSFICKNKRLSHSYLDTVRESEAKKELIESYKSRAGICPDYDTHIAHFNLFFTGTKFKIQEADILPKTNKLEYNKAYLLYYSVLDYASNASPKGYEDVVAVGVQDGESNALVVAANYPFRARAGEATLANKFEYVGSKKDTALMSIATSTQGKGMDKVDKATNLVRGIYGPYVGLGGSVLPIGRIFDIYANEASASLENQYHIRYIDKTAFYTVSDRKGLDESLTTDVFRGDCYICQFTHRLQRNFTDNDAPTNDTFVNAGTWEENYLPSEGKTDEINVGDLNCVKIGNWITFTVISSYNLSIRSCDYSYPSEEGIYGHPRGFFPLQARSSDASYKMPESGVLNAGLSTTTPYKHYYVQADLPYRKTSYQTRILYSNVAATDNFQNGFRVFKANTYRDYTTTYGGITKLIELDGSILCVFEHGIAVIPVNERTVGGNGAGGDVFINTNNVLPLNPVMISELYGSLWSDSVIKTASGVYGVDTVCKKIWRCTLKGIEILSDFKVQKFLNDSITLDERDITPIIGVRNVKTHFNAWKEDVMFTFYDNVYGDEETAWNLCWNERLGKWVTFYSWIPSFSENINNVFFSFNRETSRWASKLWLNKAKAANVYTTTSTGASDTTLANSHAYTVHISDVLAPSGKYKFELEILKDPYGYHKYFTTASTTTGSGAAATYSTTLTCTNYNEVLAICKKFNQPVALLSLHVNLLALKNDGTLDPTSANWQSTTVAYAYMYYGQLCLSVSTSDLNCDELRGSTTTAFWKHGQGGLMDTDLIKPTTWYGVTHPFEFEFVVNGDIGVLKIWNDLKIISNKARPNSFHYEIVGEGYDFSPEKANTYYRQEALKRLYSVLGSNIRYDHNYENLVEINPEGEDRAIPYQLKSTSYSYNTGVETISEYNRKATLFPLTYVRQTTMNLLYDKYAFVNTIKTSWDKYAYSSSVSLNRDYKHLTGTEIVHDAQLNEFKVWVHQPGVTLNEGGRLRGNMQYLEDKWNVQIPSMYFIQKNETDWKKLKSTSTYANGVETRTISEATKEDTDYKVCPKAVIRGALPNDITSETISNSDLYDIGFDGFDTTTLYDSNNNFTGWSNRKEAKLRDKYIRIRVRYSGKELAVIHSIITMYTISYA